MEFEIKELIRERIIGYRIISLNAMSNKYNGYTHQHIREHEGFSIWGVFSIKHKVVCLYTQDLKANILYYDPQNETLKNGISYGKTRIQKTVHR